jgi:adenine-specific DNA-methyltransferase
MLKLDWDGKEECLLEHTMPTDKQFIINEAKSVNFDTTENIIIEGDNLDVLKLLQSEYQSKVKMIYIDPPYNTGNKGVYKDKYWKARECKHSNWLSMMYPRLKLARELLRDDGVIFISIDDHEQANLKLLMDEVFGEENFVCNMPRKTKPSVTTKSKAELQTLHDYTLVYWKNKKQSSFNLKHIGVKEYLLEDDRGKFYILPLQDNGPHGTKTARPNLHYTIYQNPNGELSLEKKDGSIELLPKKHKNDHGTWMWSKKKFQKDVNNLYVKDNKVFIKHYYDANEDQNKYQTEKTWLDQFPNRLGSTILSDLGLKNIMSYPKPIEMMKFFITISTQANDIILDFFAGSGTTGHAVMQLNLEEKKQAIENGEDPTLVGNRKYIMVQLPELIDGKTDAYKAGYKTISDITIERVKRAGNKISEENPDVNLDVGFKVCELIS